MVDFSVLGISPNNLPKAKRRGDRPLLIVGGARCVWNDLKDFPVNHYDVMTINDITMHLPYPIIYVYSNDHNMLEHWVKARRPRYKKDFGETIQIHTCQCPKFISWPWPGTGSSGLNACYTGLALGYDSIVLAGIPLDDGGHYFDAPWTKTNFTKEVPDKDGEIKYWATAKKHIFNGRVRSLSGRTKLLLGE